MTRRLTRADVEAAVAASPHTTAKPLIGAHMSGGIAAGIIFATLAVHAGVWALVGQGVAGACFLTAGVGGATCAIVADRVVGHRVNPKLWATLAWAASAALAAATLFEPLSATALLGLAATFALTQHTRLGIDAVPTHRRALMRWSQWVGAALGVIVPNALGTLVLTRAADSHQALTLVSLVSAALAAAVALIAAAAVASAPGSPRYLAERDDITGCVDALLRTGRATRNTCADEVVHILIGASLRDLAKRRRAPKAGRGFGYALVVASAGVGLWVGVGPMLLVQAGAGAFTATQFVLVGCAVGIVILMLSVPRMSALGGTMRVAPEPVIVATQGTVAMLLAGAAVGSFLAPTGRLLLPLALVVSISLAAGIGVVVPLGIVAVRRWAPQATLRRLRLLIFAINAALTVAGALLSATGLPAAVFALAAATAALAVGACALIIKARPTPDVVLD